MSIDSRQLFFTLGQTFINLMRAQTMQTPEDTPERDIAIATTNLLLRRAHEDGHIGPYQVTGTSLQELHDIMDAIEIDLAPDFMEMP